MNELFDTDPEFVERFASFAFGEVISSDNLDARTCMMAVLSALLGCQGIDEYRKILSEGNDNVLFSSRPGWM